MMDCEKNFICIDPTSRAANNSGTALYRLPSEVIEIILLLDQEVHPADDLERYDDPAWKRIGVEWPRLMLVCRKFRQAAITCSRLWSAIRTDQCRKDWVDLCVERAGDHPLEVYGVVTHDSDGVENEATARTMELFTHPDLQLRHLRIHQIPGPCSTEADLGSAHHSLVLHDMTKRGLNNEHPGMRTLELLFSPPHSTILLFMQDAGFTFFGGGAVNLTCLVLDTHIIHPMPSMPYLKRLILRRFWIDVDVYYLRRTLSQTPVLSYLCLENCLNFTPEEGSFTDLHVAWVKELVPSPIVLPLLSFLELNGDIQAVSRACGVVPDPIHSLVITIRYSCIVPNGVSALHLDADYYQAARVVIDKAEQYCASSRDIIPLGRHTVVPRPAGDEYMVLRFGPALSTEHLSTLDYQNRYLSLYMVTSLHIHPQVMTLAQHALALSLQADLVSSLQSFLRPWTSFRRVLLINLDFTNEIRSLKTLETATTTEDDSQLNESEAFFVAWTNVMAAWIAQSNSPLVTLSLVYPTNWHSPMPDPKLQDQILSKWRKFATMLLWTTVAEDRTEQSYVHCLSQEWEGLWISFSLESGVIDRFFRFSEQGEIELMDKHNL